MPRPGLRRWSGTSRAWASMILVASALLPGAGRAEEDREFFEAKIRPVLVEHCYKCHSAEAEKLKGGLRLDSRDAMREGGDNGPAVVPGKPDESLLLAAIEQTGDIAKMPPKTKLPAPVVADFRRWIAAGAFDPRDAAQPATKPAVADTNRWSLRPITRPPAPAGGRNPIDAFVLAKLREKSIEPAPEADRRTLIRRLTFDLNGLPPTADEVAAFVADSAPDAYERLVDRLLASPAYGERRARQWMDLVHFAETHGHDQDRIRPNAWPYRDYLIESFNRNTPYARFAAEQLAADVLFPDEPRLAVALGMIAAGPWDESSLRDIREDSIDREIGRYIDRDDMVATAMSTFVSSTVHCARCHDHKFDPISQQDYYALQAVFAGVDRAERPYDPDPRVHRTRRELKAKRAALARRDPVVIESLLAPDVQANVAAWEERLKASHTPWTVLDPDTYRSAQGASLAKQEDRSILSSANRPAQDTYVITASTDLRPITAVRLEVLPDDRLPSRGPGRSDNGNLHLTEIEIEAAPRMDAAKARKVPIARAVADFDQAGWGVSGAIDGNGQTAWGIYPEVGKPHEAVFELRDDLGFEPGTTLTVSLQQTHPANHLIGRLRVSVTGAPRPVRPGTIPEPIAKLVAVAPNERTAVQRQDLAALYLDESLDRELAALPPQQLVYAGASDYAPDNSHKPSPVPRPVYLLKRGDIHKPGEPAVPGTLSCVAGLPSRFTQADPNDEAARRAALARWVVDPRNPLTWRSIVNRIWQFHFGRGIVDTPSDFGRMGSTPTHPELLDWLAATFRDDDGGSLKRLERRIVTSDTYRRASRHDAHAAEVDADNRLLWRMNRARLDAESVRDAILHVAGGLDRTMGGPSVRQFALSPGVHVTPVVDYTKYRWDAPDAGRRSVYRFLFRTLPDPFMDSLDGADASQLTAARTESATPLQALALLNNPFILHESGNFARRLESLTTDIERRVELAYELAYGRGPTPEERSEGVAFAAKHGLPSFCRLIFNSSEFLFAN